MIKLLVNNYLIIFMKNVESIVISIVKGKYYLYGVSNCIVSDLNNCIAINSSG